jgi:hypothetical protein
MRGAVTRTRTTVGMARSTPMALASKPRLSIQTGRKGIDTPIAAKAAPCRAARRKA